MEGGEGEAREARVNNKEGATGKRDERLRLPGRGMNASQSCGIHSDIGIQRMDNGV